MPRRAKTLQRMLTVQAQLQNMDALKLATIQQGIDRLTSEESELIGRLNGSEMPGAAFTLAAMKRLKVIPLQRDVLNIEKQSQSQAFIARSRKVKLCETILGQERDKERLRNEAAELRGILEVFVRAAHAQASDKA